ncbi:hypothetical protein OSTOST_11457, partial [Ostertagia ostertagi]
MEQGVGAAQIKRSLKTMTLFRAFLLLSAVTVSSYASLKGYDEDFILKFINRSQSLDVDPKCRDSLGKVRFLRNHLRDHDTLETQTINYFDSFGTGPSHLFLSRDQDRWVYRGYGCLVSAGETIYSKSEYPMHFCYAHEDTDSPVDAYGICIPTPCADDHVQLLKEWRAMTKPEEADLPMDFTSCTRSRHEETMVRTTRASGGLCLQLTALDARYNGHHISQHERRKRQNDVESNSVGILSEEKSATNGATAERSSVMYHVHAYLENVEYFKESMKRGPYMDFIRLLVTVLQTSSSSVMARVLVHIGSGHPEAFGYPLPPDVATKLTQPFSAQNIGSRTYIGTEFLYFLISPIFLLTLRQTPKLGM